MLVEILKQAIPASIDCRESLQRWYLYFPVGISKNKGLISLLPPKTCLYLGRERINRAWSLLDMYEIWKDSIE